MAHLHRSSLWKILPVGAIRHGQQWLPFSPEVPWSISKYLVFSPARLLKISCGIDLPCVIISVGYILPPSTVRHCERSTVILVLWFQVLLSSFPGFSILIFCTLVGASTVMQFDLSPLAYIFCFSCVDPLSTPVTLPSTWLYPPLEITPSDVVFQWCIVSTPTILSLTLNPTRVMTFLPCTFPVTHCKVISISNTHPCQRHNSVLSPFLSNRTTYWPIRSPLSHSAYALITRIAQANRRHIFKPWSTL